MTVDEERVDPDCRYPGDILECPECGGLLNEEKSMENTDRDGNRGRMMVTVSCPICGWERSVM